MEFEEGKRGLAGGSKSGVGGGEDGEKRRVVCASQGFGDKLESEGHREVAGV